MKKHKGTISPLFLIIILVIGFIILTHNSKENVITDNRVRAYSYYMPSSTLNYEDRNSSEILQDYESGALTFEQVQELHIDGAIDDDDWKEAILEAYRNSDIDIGELGEYYQSGDIEITDLEELHNSDDLDNEDAREMYREGSITGYELNEIVR